MINISVEIKRKDGDKKLFVNGSLVGSWFASVDDVAIMHHAYRYIFKLGQEAKAKEIRDILYP